MQYTKSQELFERAKEYMSGGLNANGRNRKPHPIYMSKAQDAYVYDIDGNRFIDLIMGNGTLILGHNNQEFNDLMQKYMIQNGNLVTGFDSKLSVDVAEHFLRITGNERVRFTNTGTEAVLHILHIVRAATGRNKIAVMEGAYNGWCDAVFVNSFAPLSKVGSADRPNSVPGTAGMDPKVVDDTLVLPFNNLEASENLIREYKDELAAIILEPIMIDIGLVEASPKYIDFLRSICDELGIVLVFDELLTGFRVAPGGCQEYYNVRADLCMYGKAFANGYISAAISGKEKFMDITAPGKTVAFNGTFNGHQLSICATAATLDLLESNNVVEKLNITTDNLCSEFNALAVRKGIPALMCGKGGHFQVYFMDKAPTNYREAAATNPVMYEHYVNSLQKDGVWCSQNPLSHHALSIKHDEKVVSEMLTVMDKALEAAAKAV